MPDHAKMLMVEENKKKLQIKPFLKERRYEQVAEAANQSEAFEPLNDNFFDALLIDVKMLGMVGLGRSHQLRSDTSCGPVPKVPITGRTGSAAERMSIAARIKGVIEKPLDCGKAGSLFELLDTKSTWHEPYGEWRDLTALP